MSIGNDITLCPLCHGAGGRKECPICEGEGITFTWKVDEYNEKVKGGKTRNEKNINRTEI